MKRKILSMLLAFCLLVGLFCPAAMATASEIGTFDDVRMNAWYYEGVQYAYEHNLMQGVGETKFEPEGITTRGMFVTVLWRLEGKPKSTGNVFADVSNEQYYYEAVKWAVANDIVQGYSSEVFGADNAVTREQMATIIYRYARYKNYDISSATDIGRFQDSTTVSSYAFDSMTWAVAEEIIQGTSENELNPQGVATRAQFATIMMRFNEKGYVSYRTVTFKLNYEGADIFKSTQVKSGVCVENPGAPVRSGYNFIGWYSSVDGGNSFDFGTEIKTDITLYARWEKKYSGGGSGGYVAPVSNDLTIQESGTVSNGTYDNVTISESVGDGDVTLANVVVKGKLTISGGGSNSIHMDGCNLQGDVVVDVFSNQYMDGIGGNCFAPNEAVTRGMMVTVLYRMDGENETGAILSVFQCEL